MLKIGASVIFSENDGGLDAEDAEGVFVLFPGQGN
jgi:hypothetical protein